MFYKLLNILDKKISFVTVYAKTGYQDYDPISIQLAALTLLRNTDLMSELDNKPFLTKVEQNKYSDLQNLKLESCEKIKSEIFLWFKHCNTELSDGAVTNEGLLFCNVFEKLKVSSYQVDQHTSKNLLNMTNKLVEMYWKFKGVKTTFVQCSSPINQMLCIRC